MSATPSTTMPMLTMDRSWQPGRSRAKAAPSYRPGSASRKANSESPVTSVAEEVGRRLTPTLVRASVSGASKATSSKPLARNHARIWGVMSGARRCLVHKTVAPGAHIMADASTVRLMSSVLTLPKIPHSSRMSVGSASAKLSTTPASASRTSTPGSSASAARWRAWAASRGSASTSRAVTSRPRGCPGSTPSTSRPCPAQRLSRRTGPAGARSSARDRWSRTRRSRTLSEDDGSSYAACHLTQSFTTPQATSISLGNSVGRPGPARCGLEPRVDWFAFEGEHAEHALVYPEQRLAAGEPLQRLHPQRELAGRQRALPGQVAVPEPVEVGRDRVLGTVDDPQVLGATALHPRLGDATPPAGHRGDRLGHHSLPASPGDLFPPGGHGLVGTGFGEVSHDVAGRHEDRIGRRQPFCCLHVPGVLPGQAGSCRAGQDLEGSQSQVVEG